MKIITKYLTIIIVTFIFVVGLFTTIVGTHELYHSYHSKEVSEICFLGYNAEYSYVGWVKGEVGDRLDNEFNAWTIGILAGIIGLLSLFFVDTIQ